MAFSNVQAKTTITGFNATDEAIILNALKTAYNGSSVARKMFDDWISTPTNTIQIQYQANSAFSRNSPSGQIFLDLQYISKVNYITPTGQAVEVDPVHVIVHELGHALTGRKDDGNYVTDYKGANVIYTNPMLAQLGIPERISYIATNLDAASGGILERNFQYTNGATIDRAVSRDGDWSMSLSTGNSRDLLIGGSSGNILQGSSGDDYLWGAGGDDKLYGGFGTDTVGFKGKPTDYDLRLNPDGTWTSRHVRGAANEGTDSIINVEKVLFEGGQVFNLKKKGLTYQLDFALVIDTTGSMGDDIGAVKANGTAIINALFADDKKDARIGIVGFKDNTIGEPTSIILPFTEQDQFADRKAAALNALNSISVSGGGDLPETAFDGLLKALDGTMGDWRPGAVVHRVALFTDAPAKDSSLASTVATLAANIGATITTSSLAVGTSGSVSSFTLTPIASASTQEAGFFPGSGDDDAELPPFEFADESPTPDTSIANIEIYTIYTGNFGSIDSSLESIASTTGGSSFVAPNPSDLVETLLEIINLNEAPFVQTPLDDQIVLQNLPFSFTIPTNTFADPNGDTLTYALGSISPGLPDGIIFDPSTGTFSGTTNELGAKLIEVIASDPSDANVSDSFRLRVLKNILVPNTDASLKVDGDALDNYLNASTNNGKYRLDGGEGNDVILGSDQRDVLLGGDGNDELFGNGDRDKLFGDNGDDLLDGGADIDILKGGLGADRFVLRPGDGADRILDFNTVEGDRFALDQVSFGQLTFNSNQIQLGSEILAIVNDGNGGAFTSFNAALFTTV